MLDVEFLTALTQAPSVGTACGPVLKLITQRLCPRHTQILQPDSFALFHRSDSALDRLRVILIAHLDEVGGCVYGPSEAGPPGSYRSRAWGNTPSVFAAHPLQAYDWLAADESDAFPLQAQVIEENGEERLLLRGERIRPYRTAWTFRQETRVEGDMIAGKALDPRATVYAVLHALSELDSPEVAALFVMAEECAMEVALRAVCYLQRHAPNLELIVNADVPGVQNLGEGSLQMPAIRIFEGKRFVDPGCGIRVAETLQAKGLDLRLTSSHSGSQTSLFAPLARTLSVALPSEGVHLPVVRMSLVGIERCARLLAAIAEGGLDCAF